MLDGLYQSVVIYFMAYILYFRPGFQAGSPSKNGLNIDDAPRMGIYVAATAVLVVNTYVLFNTYRWDWLTLLIYAISTLLFFFWTGVWTVASAKSAAFFYNAAPQVFGQPSFWMFMFATTFACLLPKFTAKSIQKLFFPLDADIIREQVRQGKYDYLNDSDPLIPTKADKTRSDSGSDTSAAVRRGRTASQATDTRPIYPPSVNTNNTHTRPNGSGSDGTQYTGHTMSPSQTRPSMELRPNRPSTEMTQIARERSRPSFDRTRQSMDRIRPSFEQSDHFTSAAMLTRLESSSSAFKFSRTRKSTIGEESS
jgi:phospholipid-translocating ATPase